LLLTSKYGGAELAAPGRASYPELPKERSHLSFLFFEKKNSAPDREARNMVLHCTLQLQYCICGLWHGMAWRREQLPNSFALEKNAKRFQTFLSSL